MNLLIPVFFKKKCLIEKISIFLLLILGNIFSMEFATADILEPSINIEDGKKVLHLPDVLVSQINIDHPGYRIPTSNDLTGPWGFESENSEGLPFVTWGDFNGDGSTDVAIILINDTSWMFIVYHKLNNTYVDVMRGINNDKLAQFTILSTVPKGTPFVYEYKENGKNKQLQENYSNDAIVESIYEGPVYTIHYVDGSYKFSLFGND